MGGKSAASCFKIITCVGNSEHDDHEDLELEHGVSKASSDKRRWSFRKRSATHRVLSNTVISEPLSVLVNNKENPEANNDNFHPSTNSHVPEKIPSTKCTDETPTLPPDMVDNKVVDTLLATKDINKSVPHIQESVAIVIQAAIRGYLARKETQKHKSAVKLQAVVRGHLVRRQAAGTLRCVQAIVKMQALVRARRVRQSVDNLANQVKLDGMHKTDTERLKILGKENSSSKQDKTYSSTEKLVTNGFAHQLLESTPKTKPIYINSDPSKSDSAWKWLERWMAVTSSDVGPQQELDVTPEYQEQGRNKRLAASGIANEVPVAVASLAADSKSDLTESVMPTENKDLVISDASDFEFQAPISIPDKCFSPPMKDDQVQHQFENEALDVAQEDHTKNGAVKETFSSNISETVVQSVDTFQAALDPVPICDKPEMEREKSKRTTKRVACETLETEGKKLVLGSRKTCNPAFAAAQSKFEVLSSAPASVRSFSSYQDIKVDSRVENLPSQVDSLTKDDDNITENSVSHEPRVQTATSECGTEISISSTLDSPDRSEAEGGEIVLEIGALERRNYDANGAADDASNDGNLHPEVKNPSASEALQPPKIEENNGDPANLTTVVESVQVEQQQSEPTSSDVHIHLEHEIDQQAYRSSPDGSPRSHITAPESYETPSSQISLNARKTKMENSMPSRKQRSQVVGKRSPSNRNDDSGGRSSTEHLPKDPKNVKRQNSLGMPKPDHTDHEPRISSSNSLPNYMQATESARAKAHASSSPKSSPDVHDKDHYAKKRHSLPIGNGKQGSSPRMQRSTSQAQQNAKGNGTHSPHNSAVGEHDTTSKIGGNC